MGNMKFGGDLTGITRCPHCQIATPQLKPLWVSEILHLAEAENHGRRYGAYQCTTCSEVLLAQGYPSVLAGGRWHHHDDVLQVFPTGRSVPEAIPETARRYLKQAHETLHAPDAAALMAASAIDAMLKHHDFMKGSLHSRIDEAVEKHLLTEGMGKWAHAVRLEANNVRHADAANPHLSKEQAEAVVEFADALGDFLFVLTAKIEKGAQAAFEAPTAYP